jgi:hypothetical protein
MCRARDYLVKAEVRRFSPAPLNLLKGGKYNENN